MLTESDMHPYQTQAAQFMLDNPRCNLWASMGMGKTVSTLDAFVTAQMIGLAETMLVIAPLRVAQQVWPGEPGNWEHLQHLTVVPITGTPKQRKEALATPADIHTINYENWMWLTDQVGKAFPWNWVVCDESTRLKKPSGKRFRRAKRTHKMPERWTNLTGTPASNGLLDLWAQCYLLDSGQRLGKTYTDYQRRHFESDYMGYNWTPRQGADETIRNAISDITLSIRAEDYLDLHEPSRHVIPVDLPAKAQKHYETMEREMVAEIEAGDIEALSAAAVTMKTRQIASGALYTDDAGTYEQLHNAKIDALQSVIEEANGEPVLVAYHFKSSAERIAKAIPQARMLDKDAKTVEQWNAGKLPVLMLHPASAGHGLSLQHGGRRIVFFDTDWDLELHQQVIERIGPTRQRQSGYDRAVYVYHLAARNTIDEAVIDRLQGKATVQEALQNAMRRQS